MKFVLFVCSLIWAKRNWLTNFLCQMENASGLLLIPEDRESLGLLNSCALTWLPPRWVVCCFHQSVNLVFIQFIDDVFSFILVSISVQVQVQLLLGFFFFYRAHFSLFEIHWNVVYFSLVSINSWLHHWKKLWLWGQTCRRIRPVLTDVLLAGIFQLSIAISRILTVHGVKPSNLVLQILRRKCKQLGRVPFDYLILPMATILWQVSVGLFSDIGANWRTLLQRCLRPVTVFAKHR